MPDRNVKTIRRSVALPRDLLDDVLAVAPPELKGNLNRLVSISLRDFAARRRAELFEKAMAEMARDEAIRSECATIAQDFAAADLDGMQND